MSVVGVVSVFLVRVWGLSAHTVSDCGREKSRRRYSHPQARDSAHFLTHLLFRPPRALITRVPSLTLSPLTTTSHLPLSLGTLRVKKRLRSCQPLRVCSLLVDSTVRYHCQVECTCLSPSVGGHIMGSPRRLYLIQSLRRKHSEHQLLPSVRALSKISHQSG